MIHMHKVMNQQIEKMAEDYAKILEDKARQILKNHASLGRFTDAMGVCDFYSSKTGEYIEYEDLPKAAKEFIDFVRDYSETFGNTGIHIDGK